MTKREVEAVVSSREAILNAAERIMTTSGYEKASVALICRESGLPVGSLYHHFGSKATLLAEVIRRLERPFFTGLPRSLEGNTNLDARLEAFWASAVDGMVLNYGFFKLSSELLLLSRDDPELQALMDRQDRSSRTVIAEALMRLTRLEDDVATQQAVGEMSRVIITYTRGAVMSSADDHLRLRTEMDTFFPVLRAAMTALTNAHR